MACRWEAQRGRVESCASFVVSVPRIRMISSFFAGVFFVRVFAGSETPVFAGSDCFVGSGAFSGSDALEGSVFAGLAGGVEGCGQALLAARSANTQTASKGQPRFMI